MTRRVGAGRLGGVPYPCPGAEPCDSPAVASCKRPPPCRSRRPPRRSSSPPRNPHSPGRRSRPPPRRPSRRSTTRSPTSSGKAVCFAWDHADPKRGLLRTFTANNWQITKHAVRSDFYTKPQQAMIHDAFRGLVSPGWYDRFVHQAREDAGGRPWGTSQSVAIFGTARHRPVRVRPERPAPDVAGRRQLARSTSRSAGRSSTATPRPTTRRRTTPATSSGARRSPPTNSPRRSPGQAAPAGAGRQDAARAGRRVRRQGRDGAARPAGDRADRRPEGRAAEGAWASCSNRSAPRTATRRPGA